MLKNIYKLLETCRTGDSRFPPTILYNEGWMLRLVLDWFSNHPDIVHKLAIPQDSKWYSEAELPSAFLPRYRGDKYGEGYTHADGVIGQFQIGKSGDADISLLPQTNRFVVIEAKMFSKLSPGTTRAHYYNQAARNVACMTEVIRLAGISLDQLKAVGFYVLAPKERIDAGIFKKPMDKNSIKEIVKIRVDEYDEPKEEWFNQTFMPCLDIIDIGILDWESIIKFICDIDKPVEDALTSYYSLCIKYNAKVANKY